MPKQLVVRRCLTSDKQSVARPLYSQALPSDNLLLPEELTPGKSGKMSQKRTIFVECVKKKDAHVRVSHQYDYFVTTEPMSKKAREKLSMVKSFYTKPIIDQYVLPLLCQTHPVSLRTLDWLVTNYAKNQGIVLEIDPSKPIAGVPDDSPMVTAAHGSSKKIINIYDSYNLWLKQHRRVYFDPFRRRDRIYMGYQGKWYETTVGQLVFLYWAISKRIFQYVEFDKDNINQNMNARMAELRSKKRFQTQTGCKKKREELSSSPGFGCIIFRSESQSIIFEP